MVARMGKGGGVFGNLFLIFRFGFGRKRGLIEQHGNNNW